MPFWYTHSLPLPPLLWITLNHCISMHSFPKVFWAKCQPAQSAPELSIPALAQPSPTWGGLEGSLPCQGAQRATPEQNHLGRSGDLGAFRKSPTWVLLWSWWAFWNHCLGLSPLLLRLINSVASGKLLTIFQVSSVPIWEISTHLLEIPWRLSEITHVIL